MNKKAAQANLTWTMIGVAIFVFIVITGFNAYSQFMTDNSQSISSEYLVYYGNLTGENENIIGLQEEITDPNILKTIWRSGATIINVFVIGLTSIGRFLDAIPLIGRIFTTISLAVPGFSGLFGLFLVVVTIWISMKYIQAARATGQEA